MLPLIAAALASGALKGGEKFISGRINAKKLSQVDQDRLAELERLQALGQLGLSDAQLATLKDRMVNPINAAAKENQFRARAQTQLQDIGSGASAQAQLASQSQANRERQQALQSIQAADTTRAQQQRDERLSLARSIEADKQQRKQDLQNATLSAFQKGASAAASTSKAYSGLGAAASDNAAAKTATSNDALSQASQNAGLSSLSPEQITALLALIK